MADSYPGLEESLERIIMAKQTHLLRRPGFWLSLAAVGVSTWSLFSQNYRSAVWIMFVLAMMHVGLFFAGGSRVKFSDLNARGPKNKFPEHLRWLMKKRRLASIIGERAAGLLNQCADAANVAVYKKARLFKAKASRAYVLGQRDVSSAADALMRRVVFTVRRPVVLGLQTDQAEIAKLTRLREDLRSLEAKARALSDLSEEADDSAELQRWLTNFRVLKGVLVEVEADTDSG